jgi:flagellar export protein FliJ
MKGLATLIKLRRRSLDELRRKMVTLENQKRQLQEATARLREELQREMEMAGKRPEMANFFGGFAKRIKTRRDTIAAEITSLDKQMDKLTDEIADAYGEVKKFEIAEENAQKRTEEKEKRRDTVALDEMAAQQDRRRKSEEEA